MELQIGNTVHKFYDTPGEYFSARNFNPQNQSTQKHGGTFTAMDSADVWAPILGMDQYDSLSYLNRYRSFSYACINKKALNLSKAAIKLFKNFKSKNTEKTNHPFLKLLKSSNIYGQSFKEILYLSSANCDLYGWAYVRINTLQTPFTELGKKGKTPVELIPLPAKYVIPIYDSQNAMVEYYLYNREKLMPDELIRFKIPNPISNLLPNPPVAAFNYTLDIDYLQSRSRRAFFDNDARPTLAVEFPSQLSAEEFKSYVEEYNRKQAGYRNNGRTLVSDNGAKISALNGNPRELDYVNSRSQILDEIMLILDVNRQVMGDFQGSNYNNARNALIAWISNTIEPYAEMVFNESLTKFVHDYYDYTLTTVMEYDTTDPEFNLKLADNGYKNYTLSQNERRKLFGEDDNPDPKANDPFYHPPTEAIRDTITEDPALLEDQAEGEDKPMPKQQVAEESK